MTRTTFKTQKSVLPRESVDVPMPKVKPTRGKRPPEPTLPVALLTFKRSPRGNTIAACRADVRVGYAELSTTRDNPTWVWWLSLLKPVGGQYSGRCETDQEAKDALLAAFQSWIDHAQLSPKENTK